MSAVLYTAPLTRTIVPNGLVKYFDLDVKITERDDVYTKNFPLGKLPAFIDADGFKLTETIAVSIYLIKKADPKSALLGSNDKEFASILKYASWANSDIMKHVVDAYAGVVGKVPFNKKVVDSGKAGLAAATKVLEDRLYDFTYLVGERITLADLIVAQSYFRVFSVVFGAEERKQFPNVTKWFKTVIASDILKSQFEDYVFPAKAAEFVPPKKEKAAKAPKAEKAPKAAKPAAQEEDAEPAPAPKPKHPLELLPKPKNPLDEWKRVYSNEETRESAVPWFWKNMYDPEDWSLWKVDYKYNDELTLTFMSNNLVGGFFNRLSASTKYMFGCAVVYGENNNNGITGFLFVRGQDVEPAVNVAPDWESYSFTKLSDSEEDKKFINNMLAWDEPVVIDGVSKEIVDGKVFK